MRPPAYQPLTPLLYTQHNIKVKPRYDAQRTLLWCPPGPPYPYQIVASEANYPHVDCWPTKCKLPNTLASLGTSDSNLASFGVEKRGWEKREWEKQVSYLMDSSLGQARFSCEELWDADIRWES